MQDVTIQPGRGEQIALVTANTSDGAFAIGYALQDHFAGADAPIGTPLVTTVEQAGRVIKLFREEPGLFTYESLNVNGRVILTI